MKAIEIIGRLRERYSNKYTKTPNHNKDHYINWLQDEYVELAMKQANEATTGKRQSNIPDVIKSVCDSCGCEHDLKVMKLCPDCLNSYFEQTVL